MVGWRYTIEGVYPLLSEKILTEQPQLRSTGTRCYVACEVWINGTGWHTEYKTTFGDPYAGGCFPLSCDEPPRDPTLPPEIYYPQPPTPPPPTITPPADSSVPACGQGAVGRNLNQTMLSNSIVKSRMDNVLRPKVSHHNRWAVSIGRNGSTYHVSDAREGNSTSVSIPSNPGGNLVATAKSHANGIAVPSAGDVYTFLEQVSGSPRTMEVMYTYGWGFDGEIEVYAINVHNREAASNFLNQYLKGHNLNSSGTEFIGEIGVAFNYAKNMYNEALSIELYPFRQNAVALSYVMNKFNMGITLTRKVGNGDFRTIAAMDETSGFHPMFVHLCM
ncbi:MAG: hypothetical protein LBI15_05760 [Dysgonamonadaceae bacterium]|nr:hypothetical protein [Dysgonamonadaceae bacterium]